MLFLLGNEVYESYCDVNQNIYKAGLAEYLSIYVRWKLGTLPFNYISLDSAYLESIGLHKVLEFEEKGVLTDGIIVEEPAFVVLRSQLLTENYTAYDNLERKYYKVYPVSADLEIPCYFIDLETWWGMTDFIESRWTTEQLQNTNYYELLGDSIDIWEM